VDRRPKEAETPDLYVRIIEKMRAVDTARRLVLRRTLTAGERAESPREKKTREKP
jgi:hypothetical protein